ncbi:preprotein translocase subunit SecG [Wenzhouxiangella sp. XN79A]|uniref:preprotein translocase subunit SecG n=1 Tax=Wenzhouxiangella sp. XN79A TaxID=2724193 RepID=UPI00144AC3AC|nr:preprotein translocase subunit SecG [Wenzhouxiangella sp. XN79A]NKI35739.1 preprotein translocase subunit SecG [Wenzhouxiangella sp. XN79A]
MFTVLIVLHVLLAAGLIAIVLVQRGPGATMGAAFGSGASGTVFGSRGAGNFLTRTTGWLAVGFFGISLAMAVLAAGGGGQSEDLGVVGALEQSAPEDDPEAAVDAVIEQLDSAPSGDEAEPQAEPDAAGTEIESDSEAETIPEPPVG